MGFFPGFYGPYGGGFGPYGPFGGGFRPYGGYYGAYNFAIIVVLFILLIIVGAVFAG